MELVCTNCGVSFERKRPKPAKNRFCCQECQTEWRRKQIKTINCKFCGELTKNPVFCSSSCAAKFNNVQHPKRFLEGLCISCGKPIPRRDTYCSDCNPYKVDWSAVTLGEIKARRKYQKYTQVREHARRLYISSKNTSDKCCLCGYDKHLEVCHIKPIYTFDDSTPISVVNSLNNLIGLCPNCHWELDHGLISLDFPEFDRLHS
jgi:5-methylcytosine-specific restriction endonuclease McrA